MSAYLSNELVVGIARWAQAAGDLAARVGGIGARVVGTTPDGIAHHGILQSISSGGGMVVLADNGRRYRIRTEWERYGCEDPGALTARIYREAIEDAAVES